MPPSVQGRTTAVIQSVPIRPGFEHYREDPAVLVEGEVVAKGRSRLELSTNKDLGKKKLNTP
jgi:hypothetical protein